MNRNQLRTLIGLLVLLLSGFSVLAQRTLVEIPGIYEVTPSRPINVRSFTNTRADIVLALDQGARLEVHDQLTGEQVDGTDQWFSVRVGGQEGYVLSSLLRYIAPLDNAPASASSEAEAALSTQAVNANASPATQAVLALLYDLPNREENRVISGQFGSYGDGTSRETAEEQLKAIFNQSGLTPAMTGMDYQRWDLNNQNDFTEPNSFLIAQWNAGLLVNVSWHANNPWTGGPSTDWENLDTEDAYDTRPVRELIVPGSAVHDRWMLMLDDIARGLQQLEDVGVVVMWRPLHEMNGGWAWWHRQTQEDYAALWQHMFNYFTVEKGLDNLLWTYTPMVNQTEWDYRAMHFYPGDAYVDIVGLDKYMNLDEDPLDLNQWGDYDALLTTGKPVGLFEFGPLPASGAGWDTVQYDYANLIRDIRQHYPRIVLFQAWEYVWQIGRHQNASGLLNDPWVIVQGELPTWPAG